MREILDAAVAVLLCFGLLGAALGVMTAAEVWLEERGRRRSRIRPDEGGRGNGG